MVVVADDNQRDDLFAFTCMSNYVAVAKMLNVPRSKLGTCMDSGALKHYCPDWSKFMDYKSIECEITTANGGTLKTAGMGNLHIELPNGSGKMKTILKNAIHTPEMAFTLISISRLDKASFSVTFNKGLCSIKDPNNQTIATIPHSNRLYKVVAAKPSKVTKTANVVSTKMSVTEAHRKLGHILPTSIKHAILNRFITGIKIDTNSRLEFCEACAKAKSAHQPFPKESDNRAKNFSE